MIAVKWGEIAQEYPNDEVIENMIEVPQSTLMFYQLDNATPKEDEKATEVSFSKCKGSNIQVIARAVPKIYFFKTSHTPLDMKK